jgi:hypothetical protein
MLRTMRWGGRVRWVVVVAACGVALAACGGGDGDGAKGARSLRVRLADDAPGAVIAKGTTCRFDGDRQLVAEGVVRNAGDKAYQVNVSVRFVDADGVRVDIASDSVSDLQQGESARWSASVYVDEPDDVVGCLVETSFS